MPARNVLDFNIDAALGSGAWEPRSHVDALGAAIAWQAAAVRLGGTDEPRLYQAASNGMIFQVETADDDDAGVAMSLSYTTKQFDMEAVCLVKEVYVRFDPVDDSGTLTVMTSGSEYGEVSRSYPIDFNTASGEVRVKVHRNLIGRWLQMQISGNFSNRPAPHDWTVSFISIRSGRVSR